MDLEVAGADRRLDPVPVSSRVGKRLCDRRLAGAVEAQHAARGPLRAGEESLHGFGLERPGPELAELPRRAGEHDRDAASDRDDEARSGADEADRDRRLGPGRLLADAVGEVSVRPPEPLRDGARARLDLLLERPVDDEVEPRRGREQLDRPVVVRRPEPARDDAEVGLQALAERGRELARRVADDRDPRRIEPEREQLPGQKRPVQVGALAADELAAGDDDRGPGPPGGRS